MCHSVITGSKYITLLCWVVSLACHTLRRLFPHLQPPLILTYVSSPSSVSLWTLPKIQATRDRQKTNVLLLNATHESQRHKKPSTALCSGQFPKFTFLTQSSSFFLFHEKPFSGKENCGCFLQPLHQSQVEKNPSSDTTGAFVLPVPWGACCRKCDWWVELLQQMSRLEGCKLFAISLAVAVQRASWAIGHVQTQPFIRLGFWWCFCLVVFEIRIVVCIPSLEITKKPSLASKSHSPFSASNPDYRHAPLMPTSAGNTT